MSKRSPTRSAVYDPSARKTFRSALCHLLGTEFPGVFGPTVTQLFAERVEELFERFHPPRSRLKVGQVFWAAVAVDDPPARHKRIEDTKLVPIVLDLVTAQDIDEAIHTGLRMQTRQRKVIRLFEQAHQQGAVLSYPDVSLLMHVQTSTISRHVLDYERTSNHVVPRRGTVHDMGRSVSHKRLICYKRLVEKKTTSQVATETFHDPEEVEYYVQSMRRIALCHDKAMSLDDIALATGHSKSLVQEYLDLIEEFHIRIVDPAPQPSEPKEVTPMAKST